MLMLALLLFEKVILELFDILTIVSVFQITYF